MVKQIKKSELESTIKHLKKMAVDLKELIECYEDMLKFKMYEED